MEREAFGGPFTCQITHQPLGYPAAVPLTAAGLIRPLQPPADQWPWVGQRISSLPPPLLRLTLGFDAVSVRRSQ